VVSEEDFMDENSLYSLRRAPPEEFARRLRASLQRQSAAQVTQQKRIGKLVAFAASCVAIVGAFTVPSVRAAAQAFLDMFRVVHFAALPINSATEQRLRSSEFDLPHLLADQVQVSPAPTAPTAYPTPEAAEAAAGFQVRRPTWMPVGWDIQAPTVEVVAGKTARITANTARVERILSSLDINDVTLPAGLNGQTATVHISPSVVLKWQQDGKRLELLQSPSPRVDLPPGTDLATLGEIGLRVLGLSRDDAYRFAQNIDWRTTLLVPVPANAASFREVNVRGGSGLLLELTQTGSRRHAGSLLLWSDGTQVFALSGAVSSAELLEMAQSVQ
jgi:hypothetical protein